MKLTQELKSLRLAYIVILLVGVAFVILMHTFERPTLDVFRVPTFIGFASGYNGLPYWPVLRIYQLTMYTSLVVLLIDIICLSKYRSKLLLQLSEISTVVGLTLLSLTFFFFVYNFLFFDLTIRSTALIYIAVSTVIILVDLINFKVDERLLKKELNNGRL